MSEKLVFIIILCVIVVLLVLFILMAKIFVKNRQNAQKKQVLLDLPPENKSITIADLIEIVSDPHTSREHIFKAIRYFLANFKIPPKKEGIAPHTASVYLQFITQVAAHPKSDAKLISYLDNELKKVSAEYTDEIDEAENRGIKYRK